MNRIAVLFLPSLSGLLWRDHPGISIAWSLAGSLFIAIIAQTRWFTESTENLPVSHRLLRPPFAYHFFFLGYHVVGAGFHALNNAGYSVSGGGLNVPTGNELFLDAVAQRLMLLAQASVTTGMKLGGLRYAPPKYIIPYIPPYSLLVVSFICLDLGTVLTAFPSLSNSGYRILQIASVAVLVEITFAVAEHKFQN